MVHPPLDLDHIPLVDRYFKIHETLSKFDLFDIYCWWEDKFVDEVDDIGLQDTNLPFYIFPKSHSFPELITKRHSCYNPQQREVMAQTGHILFTIDAKSIMQMMQAPVIEGTTPFSREVLIEMYQKLDFCKRDKTLELFMTEQTPLPNKHLSQIRILLIPPLFSLIEPGTLSLFLLIYLAIIQISGLMKLSYFFYLFYQQNPSPLSFSISVNFQQMPSMSILSISSQRKSSNTLQFWYICLFIFRHIGSSFQ